MRYLKRNKNWRGYPELLERVVKKYYPDAKSPKAVPEKDWIILVTCHYTAMEICRLIEHNDKLFNICCQVFEEVVREISQKNTEESVEMTEEMEILD